MPVEGGMRLVISCEADLALSVRILLDKNFPATTRAATTATEAAAMRPQKPTVGLQAWRRVRMKARGCKEEGTREGGRGRRGKERKPNNVSRRKVGHTGDPASE
jgi:hypothetical protein